MNITFTEKEGKMIVSMEGRLDTTTSPYAEDKLSESAEGYKNIVFDFTELAYVSSAGLRLLLGWKKKIDKEGGTFEITGCNDEVKEIFDITGFTDVFKLK